MAINHASLGRRGLGNHVAKYWLLIGLGPGLSYLPYSGVLDQLRMERDDNETERTSDVTLTTSSYAIAERPRDALS